jgi:hypothetical protein
LWLKQRVPRASQRGLNPCGRGQHDVQVAALDLLYRARIQPGSFSELLLRHFAGDPRPADGVAKLLERLFLGYRSWHGVLRRARHYFDHAPLGRVWHCIGFKDLGSHRSRNSVLMKDR